MFGAERGLRVFADGQGTAQPLPPFLEDFKRNNRPDIRSRKTSLASALGPVDGFLARPDTKEQLPAILIVHDETGLTDWMKQNARELSGIGYVVLALDLSGHVPKTTAEGFREDEAVLTKLSAAIRWLRRQSDVLPERIGVVGWSWGAGQALALAASVPLQACVVCCGPVTIEPAVLAGLGRTPLLGIFAVRDPATSRKIDAFRQALRRNRIPHKILTPPGVTPGFMGPPGHRAYVEQQAEDAWVEVYEFLGKYVEDADTNPRVSSALAPPVATIKDIMRSANAPTGLRGHLAGALETEPAGVGPWRQIRADAALLAEAAGLLENLKPPRGSTSDWHKQVDGFRKTARELVTASERHDYKSARDTLEDLGKRCAGCHTKHR